MGMLFVNFLKKNEVNLLENLSLSVTKTIFFLKAPSAIRGSAPVVWLNAKIADLL
jgi:hypothetical protein